MLLEQGHEPEELRVQPEPVTRNVHGQSLEDARAAFRTEWRAKIQEKRRQVEQARKYEEWWSDALRVLGIGGTGVGAVIGLLAAIGTGVFGTVPYYIFFGAIIGFTLVMPLVVVAMLRTASSRMRAEHLEQELRQLERS